MTQKDLLNNMVNVVDDNLLYSYLATVDFT